MMIGDGSMRPPESKEAIIPIPDEKHLGLWKAVENKPLNQTLWETVITLAESEENTEISQIGPYSSLGLTELVELSDKVRQTTDSVTKYSLLAQQTSSGEYWFDVLTGLRFNAGIRGIKQFIAESRQTRDVAVDIGTGTGEVANEIFPYFNTVYATDRVPALIELGNQRKKRENIHFVEADVLSLPFEDESVDVITASGILLSFEPYEQRKLAQELKRILKKDGYIISSAPKQDEATELLACDVASAINGKGILAELIVDEVNGWNYKQGRPSWRSVIKTFKEMGLLCSTRENTDHTDIMFVREDHPNIPHS